VPDAGDPGDGWTPPPGRRRFAAITAGLNFVEAARKAVSQLERGEWDDAVRPDSSRPPGLGDLFRWGDRTVEFMEGSPKGRDGTGKDLDAVLSDVREWRDRLHAAVRDHPAAAVAIFRREVAEGLPRLEGELRDEEMLRWMIEDVPEELGLVLDLREGALGALRGLEVLGQDVSEDWRRLAAFDAGLRAHGADVPGEPTRG
jgi:hypothetical protein